MKKINNLIAAFLVMAVGVMGIGTVYADDAANGTPGSNNGAASTDTAAASKVRVHCESTELAVGASTLCTVKVTPSAALAASTTAVKNVVIKASQSKYLTMSEVQPATGFILGDHDEDNKNLDTNTINLTYSGTLKAGEEINVMSFQLKLEESAKNITDGDCGRICITGVMFDTETTNVGDDGKYCPNITIVSKNCKDEECNPKTGEFMNYAVIAGVASVALVSIVVISKKKKFYTV